MASSASIPDYLGFEGSLYKFVNVSLQFMLCFMGIPPRLVRLSKIQKIDTFGQLYLDSDFRSSRCRQLSKERRHCRSVWNLTVICVAIHETSGHGDFTASLSGCKQFFIFSDPCKYFPSIHKWECHWLSIANVGSSSPLKCSRRRLYLTPVSASQLK